MKKYKVLLLAIIAGLAMANAQSSTSSYTQTLRFLNSDMLQIYQGARIAAPSMTLPSSTTTYTSTLKFTNSDNLQIYNAVRGIGQAVSSGTSTGWQLSGNSVSTNTAFIGTTSNRSFLLKTNNIQRLKIDSLGQAVFTHTDVNTPALSVKNSTVQFGIYMDSPTASIPTGLGTVSNNNFGFFTNFNVNIAAFTTNNRFSIGKPNFTSYSLPASLLELRSQSTSSANKVFGVRNSTDVSDVFYISDVGTMSVSSTFTSSNIRVNSGSIANEGIKIQEAVSATGYGAFYAGVTPSSTNYSMRSNSLYTDIAASTSIRLITNGSAGVSANVSDVTITLPLKVNTTMSVSSTFTAGNVRINTGSGAGSIKSSEYFSNLGALYFNQTTPDGGNYAISGSDNANTLINGKTNLNLRINGSDIAAFTSASGYFINSIAINKSSAPVASAALEIQSTTKGFLPPRMTDLELAAIASPATGLTVYCTNCTANDATAGVMVTYNGSTWKNHW